MGAVDWQPYINMALASVFAVAGWFIRQVWDAVQDLKKDVQALEIKLPSEYVRKDDLVEALERVYKALDRIEHKLDKKADKV